MPYFLWDWNGTLLDDTQAAVNALNGMLAVRGLPPIGLDFYRERFAFPVKPFYAAAGFRLAEEDWDALAREYHAAYGREPLRLNAEAREALAAVRVAGAGQSVVSALRQDLLSAAVTQTGVADFFDYVWGTDNLDGDSKIDRARELLGRLPSRGPFVLIGDSLHDREVADAIGARCILCSQGSHSAARLRAVAPTAETLCEAVRMALESVR